MSSTPSKVRFVFVSDTHNHRPGEGFTLPKGDVLIHAGDLTNQGSYHELQKAAEWIAKADFAVKIVIGGNHDLSLDPNYALKYDSGWTVASGNIEKCRDLMRSLPGVVYLQHSGADIQVPGRDVSIRVFGSPYSPEQLKQNWAFQYPEKQAHNTWEAIPSNTDIFITHTPPAGYCDASQHWIEGGCPALAQTLSRIKPAMHICGHCHEGRGAQVVRWDDKPGVVNSVRIWEDTSIGTKKQSLLDLTGHRGGRALEYGRETAVINASVMAKSWDTGAKSFNKPIVVDIDFPTP